MTTEELYEQRQQAQALLRAIDAELDRWEDIECQVCGAQDLAYRGEPFITWEKVNGWFLCPHHTYKFEHFEELHSPEHLIKSLM